MTIAMEPLREPGRVASLIRRRADQLQHRTPQPTNIYLTMPTQFSPLETSRLILRRFQESDLVPFHAYRSDPEIEKYQGWGEFTLEDARQFIANQGTGDPGAPGAHIQIAIELKSTSEMIGDVYVYTPEREPEQARLGYSIATAHQRHGYATEAVTAMLNYLFGPLSKHRVSAGADAENTASIGLMERLGMRREAHFIQSAWYRGQWTDEVQYAILQSEWQTRGS